MPRRGLPSRKSRHAGEDRPEKMKLSQIDLGAADTAAKMQRMLATVIAQGVAHIVIVLINLHPLSITDIETDTVVLGFRFETVPKTSMLGCGILERPAQARKHSTA